jgi:nucleotide-binding universal stress UspA family protein
MNMFKILLYTDGQSYSTKALHLAGDLKRHLDAELSIITVRSGTHATEAIPPVGVDFPLSRKTELPEGIQILIHALEDLTSTGLFTPPTNITIHDISSGYIFAHKTISGDRVPFYIRYGHFIEVLNQEVAEKNYNLVIIAPPRRNKLRRFVLGDTTRILALDLHASILVVRGGNLNSRFLICADGSPSARQIFPFLKHLFSAIRKPMEIIWVQDPELSEAEAHSARAYLDKSSAWLDKCGKSNALVQVTGDQPLDSILDKAGEDSVVVLGASLRHDIYRRMLGSLPLQIMSKTESSVLLVKRLPESDIDLF